MPLTGGRESEESNTVSSLYSFLFVEQNLICWKSIFVYCIPLLRHPLLFVVFLFFALPRCYSVCLCIYSLSIIPHQYSVNYHFTSLVSFPPHPSLPWVRSHMFSHGEMAVPMYKEKKRNKG